MVNYQTPLGKAFLLSYQICALTYRHNDGTYDYRAGPPLRPLSRPHHGHYCRGHSLQGKRFFFSFFFPSNKIFPRDFKDRIPIFFMCRKLVKKNDRRCNVLHFYNSTSCENFCKIRIKYSIFDLR